MDHQVQDLDHFGLEGEALLRVHAGTLPAGVHAPGPFGPIIVPNGPGASLTGCRARSLKVSGGARPPRGTRPRAVTPGATRGSSSMSGRRCSVSRRAWPVTATSFGGGAGARGGGAGAA